MTMELTRRYPEATAGPFPEPPATITDAEGRELAIESLGTDGAVVDALTRMYAQFHPTDRAQGIPPTGEDRIRDWLEPLVENGLNVAVRPRGPEGDGATATDTTPDPTDDRPGYVGHAVLVPDTDEPGATADPGEYEWELAIFVLQEYQGAGIGTSLLAHLLGEAAATGIEHVWLTVERWNGAAISLYKRTGFETVSTESFDIEMAIRLDGS